MTPPPPRYTLFPYTTLFRSRQERGRYRRAAAVRPPGWPARGASSDSTTRRDARGPARVPPNRAGWLGCPRSEEHTCEFQSQSNLVCRRLLEKENKSTSDITP